MRTRVTETGKDFLCMKKPLWFYFLCPPAFLEALEMVSNQHGQYRQQNAGLDSIINWQNWTSSAVLP
jgi:hypothetical protein